MAPASREGSGDGAAPARPTGPYPVGLAALLVTVGMLFAALTATLLVRRTGADWSRIALPRILYVNTGILALSSVAVETARAAIRRDRSGSASRHLGIAAALGLLFLVGQAVAWQRLRSAGLLLASGPYVAYVYLLSALHGAHVLGGLGALEWTRRRARQGRYTARRHAGLRHAAAYWHFVGGIWLYLLALLSLA